MQFINAYFNTNLKTRVLIKHYTGLLLFEFILTMLIKKIIDKASMFKLIFENQLEHATQSIPDYGQYNTY